MTVNGDEQETMEGGDPRAIEVVLPVLDRVARVAESLGIDHGFMGGLASTVHGRDRMTHDIDILVRRRDALRLLEALAAEGFETERRDEKWLYKATLDDILVDIIFETGVGHGILELDDEMAAHITRTELDGVAFNVIAPEDLLVIKVLALKEKRSRHWFDALGVLAAGHRLDWDYLVRRARIDPERVASLLVYARAERLTVPDRVLAELLPLRTTAPAPDDPYELRRIKDALAADPRTAELEVDVTLSDGELLLTGVVATDARRAALTEVAGEVASGRSVRNLATVAPASAEPHVEHLS
jgi:hypothetical protein